MFLIQRWIRQRRTSACAMSDYRIIAPFYDWALYPFMRGVRRNVLGMLQQSKPGLVIDVCSTRGCWIYLAGDRDFEKIRIKVTDGEIVFPMEARGKKATVVGVVESMELTREDVIKRRKHHAEETGAPFDPSTVTSGETVLRIRGLGASIPGI